MDKSIKTTMVQKGEIPVPPGEPKRTGYTFDGWKPEIIEATQEVTYKAQWHSNDPIRYNITWDTGDGVWSNGTNISKVIEVEENHYPTPPEEPNREGYEFVDWSPAIVPATEDTTYVATWREIIEDDETEYCTVTWYNRQNGTKLKSKTFEKGDTVTSSDYPSPGNRTGYTFDSWSKDAPFNITKDIDIYGLWVKDEEDGDDDEPTTPVAKTVTSITVDSVSLDYPNKIPVTGGKTTPTLSYKITINYSDGSKKTVTSGANVKYTSTKKLINATSGVVTKSTKNSTTSEIIADTVTVTVTYAEGGISKSGTATANAIQDKKRVVKIYSQGSTLGIEYPEMEANQTTVSPTGYYYSYAVDYNDGTSDNLRNYGNNGYLTDRYPEGQNNLGATENIQYRIKSGKPGSVSSDGTVTLTNNYTDRTLATEVEFLIGVEVDGVKFAQTWNVSSGNTQIGNAWIYKKGTNS